MVGIDIIEVERVEKSEAFLQKIAHEKEIEYINKTNCENLRHQRIASLFSVKEAVMKALEMGANSGVVFKDIELSHNKSGKPEINLHGKAKEKFEDVFAGKKIEVSISHTKTMATAIAIIQ